MFKRILLPLLAAVLSLGAMPGTVLAGPMTFTSPIDFLNTLGNPDDTLIDFNDYTADALFQNSTLDVGPLSFSSSGTEHIGLNKIETRPVDLPLTAPNPTPYAALYLKTSTAGSTTVTLTFDEPIIGFGATFRSLNRDTEISYTTSSGAETIVPGITNRFFGFILETGNFISSLMFSAPVENGFGLDNILLSNAVFSSPAAASVDAPNTLLVTLLSFMLVLAWGFRHEQREK